MTPRALLSLAKAAAAASALVMLLATAPLTASAGPVAFSGTAAYTQDFQTMTGSTTFASTVSGSTMLEVSTLAGGTTEQAGWYVYGIGSTPRWGASNGSSTTGAFFQLYDDSGNRALGSQASSSFSGFSDSF